MNKENQQVLINDFPNLYKKIVRGFECGDGWTQLIRNLSENLESLILQLSEKERDNLSFFYAKEKFGTLRYDINYSKINQIILDRINACIADAENESASICERCGEPGKLTTIRNWMMVRCTDCEVKENNRK